MKLIIATIEPQMLDDVVYALHQIEDFPGATIADVKGTGKGFHQSDHSNVRPDSFEFPLFKRLEIICADDQCEEITRALRENASTGNVDDGTIVVVPTDHAVGITGRLKRVR